MAVCSTTATAKLAGEKTQISALYLQLGPPPASVITALDVWESCSVTL